MPVQWKSRVFFSRGDRPCRCTRIAAQSAAIKLKRYRTSAPSRRESPRVRRRAGAATDCAAAELQGRRLVCKRLRREERIVGERTGRGLTFGSKAESKGDSKADSKGDSSGAARRASRFFFLSESKASTPAAPTPTASAG